jgi:hypothetical protein
LAVSEAGTATWTNAAGRQPDPWLRPRSHSKLQPHRTTFPRTLGFRNIEMLTARNVIAAGKKPSITCSALVSPPRAAWTRRATGGGCVMTMSFSGPIRRLQGYLHCFVTAKMTAKLANLGGRLWMWADSRPPVAILGGR